MPYSQQFKFVFLATNPLCPRWLACWAINSWMTALYAKCGIAGMGPATGSEHNFTGQCNDAFFQLAHQVSCTGWHMNIKQSMMEPCSCTWLCSRMLCDDRGR